MKRVCAFVGIICLMLLTIGVRLKFCRLDVFIDGTYSAFAYNDTPASITISKGYERVDINYGQENVESVLKKLKAKIIKRETVGDISIIYAYSPCLLKGVNLFGGRVNVMIASTSSSIVVGSPLIKGSF